MTQHNTDFVSTLYAERANILSAQGLLSKRLVALDELLAVYGARTPASPLPGEVAGATSAGEVDPPPSASPATIPEPEITGSTAGETAPNSRVIHVTIAPKTSAEAPGSEAAVDDADAAPAGEAPAPDASPAPISTRQRVKQLHDEHPEYTRREAWEALGITEGSLAGHSHALRIKWAPLDPVRFERPAPPPPREDAITPDETVTPSNGFSAPRPSRPKGAQFRLRAGRGEGKYLHMSGVGMTDNRSYAWIGTEAQLVKVRQKFPEARELVEEVVEKEPAR